MALVIDDRVRETTTVTGTSDITLLGAVTGFQSFAVIGNGNTTFYTLSDQAGSNWEVGIGTYSSVGPTLARTTILSSSNSGSIVSFPPGTKDVFVTYPSEKAVYLDASGNAQPALGNIVTSQVNVTGQGDLRLEDSSGGEYVALQAPSSLTSSYTLTMPADDGTSGQVLSTNGSGVLSWVTDGGGDVVGPASATDNGVALFDGTTGKLLKNSSSFVQTADGVGIGTSSPQTKLDVQVSSGRFQIYSAVNVTGPRILAVNTAGSAAVPLEISSTNTLFTNGSNTELMRITSGGLVGIGTNNPTYTLHVNGGTGSLAPQLVLQGTTTSSISFLTNAPVGSYNGITQAGDPIILGVLNQGLVVGVHDGSAIRYGDTDMIFATNSIERMRIDASGNLGINAIPSAWDSGYKVLQVNQASLATVSGSPSIVTLSANRFASTSETYIANGNATVYAQDTGKHIWYTAPSGTAGSAITFTQAMTLDASGNLGIAINSPTRKFQVQGDVGIGTIATSGSYAVTYNPDTSGNTVFWTKSDGYFAWGTGANPYSGGVERVRIDAVGNFGIGVIPKVWYSSRQALSVGVATSLTGVSNNYTELWTNAYLDNSIVTRYVNSGAASLYQSGDGEHYWSTAPSGTAGASCTMTQRMRLDISGNLLVGQSATIYGEANRGVVEINGATNALLALNIAGSVTNGGYILNSATALSVVARDNRPFTLSVNGAERMRVDSSGRVITPYQPSFRAYQPSVAPDAGNTFSFLPYTTFQAIPTNTGSNFNATNGRFTAPVAGVYFFGWGGLVGQSGGAIRMVFAVNGGPTSNGTYSDTGTWQANTAAISLSANDYVQCGLVTGVGNSNHTEFTGFLIG